MKWMLGNCLLAIVICADAATAQAADPDGGGERSAVQEVETSSGALIAGSAVGWLLGLAAGVAVGYAVQPDAGESWVGAAEWWVGGWIGSSVGSAAGAHLANGRRGNLLYGTIGSLVVAPVLAAVTFPVGGSGAVLTPGVQIGVTVWIERQSSERR